MDINTNMKHKVIRWMEWNWTGRFGLLVRFGKLERLLTLIFSKVGLVGQV